MARRQQQQWWVLMAATLFGLMVANCNNNQPQQQQQQQQQHSSSSSSSSSSSNANPHVVSRIAFGSCANQSSPQPIWNAILKFDPHVFIWLGDNIYGDIRRPLRVFGKERTIGPWKNVPRFVPCSQQELKSRYLKAKSIPAYSRLRHNAFKVIGTWDDHDYGLNDAGKEFPNKHTNQRLLLDFLDEPQDSPRRNQQGVYTSYTFGPHPSTQQLKVILLDTRYHRDPLFSDGTILGTSQWTWLENELTTSPPSAITIIASSIQVISNLSATTGPLFYLESWGRFPKERDRLFKLIADSKRDGVIFISGDVHFGEITRDDCAATGYPLYDITSSGLTQAIENTVPAPLHFLVRFVAWLTPTTMRVVDRNCRYSSCTFGQPNFGAIEIDWAASPVTVRIEVRDTSGHPVAGVNISLSELRSGNINSSATLKRSGEIQRHCSLEVSLPWIVRYRLAIFFYSTLAVVLVALVGLSYVSTLACRKCLHKCKRD
ncbi:Alkaline phosphatase D-related [Trema orientale]|uniref:Alkaline phosphatase D-related n=1 Tax=Trema orientale TaxID=63057 RepID=A0A2P5DIZ3_TREOI|nr:Alkaline phosphatase D-related [Trema orientale]